MSILRMKRDICEVHHKEVIIRSDKFNSYLLMTREKREEMNLSVSL